MKLFDRDGKWNWVDENNVVLGYDNRQDCCESAGYFYLDRPPVADDFSHKRLGELEKSSPPFASLDDYRFDPSSLCKSVDAGRNLDDGGAVISRLVHVGGGPDIYLVLFNCHNGYYSHGFEFKVGDKAESGVL